MFREVEGATTAMGSMNSYVQNMMARRTEIVNRLPRWSDSPVHQQVKNPDTSVVWPIWDGLLSNFVRVRDIAATKCRMISRNEPMVLMIATVCNYALSTIYDIHTAFAP